MLWHVASWGDRIPHGLGLKRRPQRLSRKTAFCGSRLHAACAVGYIPGSQKSNTSRLTMRAEIQKLVDEIKQSIGLLRRHL
jgi:hypothetical protein